MIKISAVLIVKNEEVLLPRCLDSLKGIDEIIIQDSGSIDKTMEVASKYTDKIYYYRWHDHFADARNAAKKHATGDYILSIDADEILHDMSKVREAVALAEQKNVLAVNCTLVGETVGDSGKAQRTTFPRLFKNDERVWWEGAAHNHLSVQGEDIGNVKITFGFSPAHHRDPDRTFRILKKEVESRPDAVRETFYLGREYWYRKDFENAVKTMGQYVQKGRFLAEKAEAFFIMAQAYQKMGMGEDARDACLQAIKINSHFKEAVQFMAVISGKGSGNERWEKNAQQWERMAETADNSNVLFVRV